MTPPEPDPGPSAPLFEGLTYSRAKNAFWLGFFSVTCFGFLTGIPAVFVGAQALTEIDASRGRLIGKSSAWIGVVLGTFGTIASSAALEYARSR